MNIGSAKPEKEILQRVPHHLIDICDPAQAYSAARFREDALAEMAAIVARGNIPLLTGGTMLYFKILRDGMADLPETSEALRTEIIAEAEKIGWPAMHEKLARVDPVTAARLHPNHSQRIGRALEVFRMTGEPLSAFHARQKQQNLPYRLLQLGLLPEDRDWLYRRIDHRFDQMMQQGFLEEVKNLYKRGDLSDELPAIRSVGYRQAWEYLQACEAGTGSGGVVGESLTRAEMVERAKMASRQLAKRQLTWLRSWPDLQIISIGTDIEADSVVGASCLRAVNAFLYPGPLG
jgi:tRNA dimethylallyltransferase